MSFSPLHFKGANTHTHTHTHTHSLWYSCCPPITYLRIMISIVKTTLVGWTSNKCPITAVKCFLSAHPEDCVSISDASPRIIWSFISWRHCFPRLCTRFYRKIWSPFPRGEWKRNVRGKLFAHTFIYLNEHRLQMFYVRIIMITKD